MSEPNQSQESLNKMRLLPKAAPSNEILIQAVELVQIENETFESSSTFIDRAGWYSLHNERKSSKIRELLFALLSAKYPDITFWYLRDKSPSLLWEVRYAIFQHIAAEQRTLSNETSIMFDRILIDIYQNKQG